MRVIKLSLDSCWVWHSRNSLSIAKKSIFFKKLPPHLSRWKIKAIWMRLYHHQMLLELPPPEILFQAKLLLSLKLIQNQYHQILEGSKPLSKNSLVKYSLARSFVSERSTNILPYMQIFLNEFLPVEESWIFSSSFNQGARGFCHYTISWFFVISHKSFFRFPI